MREKREREEEIISFLDRFDPEPDLLLREISNT